jgi:hypothetical protein
MQFPSRGGRLFLLLFGVTLGPLLLIVPASAWLNWTLSPLQKSYLNAYTASYFGAGVRHGQTTVRWVMKTAPKRKPVAASPEDVVAGPDLKSPIALSPKAVAEGWRGVVVSAPEKSPSGVLNTLLREYVYDGESVCQGRSKSGPVGRSKREPLWV